MEDRTVTLPRLKDFKGEKIDIDCRRCDRYGVYDRKALVKKFGASAEFASIRRKLAVGCDRRGSAECEARIPCLLTLGCWSNAASAETT